MPSAEHAIVEGKAIIEACGDTDQVKVFKSQKTYGLVRYPSSYWHTVDYEPRARKHRQDSLMGGPYDGFTVTSVLLLSENLKLHTCACRRRIATQKMKELAFVAQRVRTFCPAHC